MGELPSACATKVSQRAEVPSGAQKAAVTRWVRKHAGAGSGKNSNNNEQQQRGWHINLASKRSAPSPPASSSSSTMNCSMTSDMSALPNSQDMPLWGRDGWDVNSADIVQARPAGVCWQRKVGASRELPCSHGGLCRLSGGGGVSAEGLCAGLAKGLHLHVTHTGTLASSRIPEGLRLRQTILILIAVLGCAKLLLDSGHAHYSR